MFTPAPDAGVRLPVYAFGRGPVKAPVFTCPVSAIPDWVWSVIELWVQSRTLRLPVRAGGVVDQPFVVRTYFPVLDAEMGPNDPLQALTGPR